jgi:hypothetical protein
MFLHSATTFLNSSMKRTKNQGNVGKGLERCGCMTELFHSIDEEKL